MKSIIIRKWISHSACKCIQPPFGPSLNGKKFNVNRLIDLSEAMNYNFLREIADKLDIQEPVPRTAEGEPYLDIIARQETKIEILQEILANLKK